MNEYQIHKQLSKVFDLKFIFVKNTKNSILILLNKSEDSYLKTSKMLTGEEESGVLAIDLADFIPLTESSTVSRFFNNNKGSISKKLKLSYQAKLLKDGAVERNQNIIKKDGPLEISGKRFDSEKELIHYIKSIVTGSKNGKSLDPAHSNFIKGKI
jgi:hypothetical protein